MHSFNEFGNQATSSIEFEYYDGDFVVIFPDPNLEAVIRDTIEKPTGIIMFSDVKNIERLGGYNSGVNDLTGLEYCVSLIELDMSYNNIDNICPINSLKNLKYIHFANNNIIDCGCISEMTNLESIDLRMNDLEEISFLTNLTAVRYLYLEKTSIKTLEPIENLTNIESLMIEKSPLIVDYSIIGNFSKLIDLNLSYSNVDTISFLYNSYLLRNLSLVETDVQDISPIVNLPSLSFMNTEWSPLSEESCLSIYNDLNHVFVMHTCPGKKPYVVSGDGVYGETINQNGYGFWPGGEVELHFRHETGFEDPVLNKIVDENGNYIHNYSIPDGKPTGIWYYWAVDLTTKIVTPEVSYQINEN